MPGPPSPQTSTRPQRRLRYAWGAVWPTLAGVLSVVALYLLLFAADFLFGTDLRVFGVYDADTERFALTRYGRDIIWHQLTVLAAYAGFGLVSGLAAAALLSLWERSGALPQRRAANSAMTPVELPPTPWSATRRALLSLPLGLALHLVVFARALQLRPALFAEALYDRGGLPRRMMLAISHGRALPVLWTLGLTALIFAVAAPLLSPRGRLLLSSLRQHLGARRRHSLLAALALLLVLVGAYLGLRRPTATNWETARPTSGVPQATRPSVLLIAIDSLRADRLDGSPRSRQLLPTLSALAGRSVAFDSARVTVPRTFPSIVTLLTGRYPHSHGIRTMFPTLSQRAKVPKALPRLLREAGYHTSVLSDFCGEIFSRIDLGYEHSQVPSFDARTIVLQRALTLHKNLLPYFLTDAGRPLAHALFPELDSLAEIADSRRLADDSVAALAGSPNQPFFTTVFFSSAHFPYAAPAPYYRQGTDPAYRGAFRYYKPPLAEPASSEDIAQVRGLYDGALAAADDGVARLLSGLARLGRLQSTIVIVLADHGENLYDAPGRGMGHGDHLEGDPSLHVPLIIYDPVHAFPAHRVPGIVRDIDVVPTLLGLLGLPPPPDGVPLDGVDLRPLLTGEKESLGLSAFHETELWFTASGPGFEPDKRLPYPAVTSTTAVDAHDDIALAERFSELVTVAKHRALRTEDWKLIYRPTRGGARFSLFDMHSDPQEQHDVAEAHPEVVQKLRTALFDLVSRDPTITIETGFILPR
jgi:arylsulfatase A-like enzyme